MAQEFQREYLLRLPLPLAQLYSRAYNAKDARGRHDNTFYLFEALVKLAAAPAVATATRPSAAEEARTIAAGHLLYGMQAVSDDIGPDMAGFRPALSAISSSDRGSKLPAFGPAG